VYQKHLWFDGIHSLKTFVFQALARLMQVVVILDWARLQRMHAMPPGAQRWLPRGQVAEYLINRRQRLCSHMSRADAVAALAASDTSAAPGKMKKTPAERGNAHSRSWTAAADFLFGWTADEIKAEARIAKLKPAAGMAVA
jgi:hypothetical protein